MDWSPDGRWLLTAARVDEPNAGLPRERFRAFVRKADGSDAHLLTESDGADDTYRFAPDSRQVVFIRREPGKSEFYSLWVVNRDGTELRKVIAGTPEIHPFFACWSPDGKRLAVNMIRTGQDDRGRPTSFDSHVQFFASDGKPGRRLDLPHAYVIPVDWR
jgi:Tol biopolymer transport system component